MWGWLKNLFKSKGILGVCRHEATYCMFVFGEHHQCQVVRGHRGGVLHAQAQALLDGKWTWLSVSNGTVYPTAPDPTFAPKDFFAPWQWMEVMLNTQVAANREIGHYVDEEKRLSWIGGQR
jgi:hypothetical protein